LIGFRSSISISSLIVLTVGLGLAQQAEPPVPHVSSVVHGLFLDANLKQLEPTPDLILQLQDDYIKRLETGLGTADRDALKKKQETIGAMPEAERVWANTSIILSNANKLPGESAVTLRSNSIMLLSKYAGLIGKPLDLDAIIAGKFPDWMKGRPGFNTADLINALNVLRRGNYRYSALCHANNVPVPPTWRGQTGGGGWVPVTPDLKVNYLTQPGQFPHSKSQIFSYTPTSGPMGLCPIIQDTVGNPGNFNALGIICQGLATATKPSHACFWDNAVDNIPLNQVAAITNIPIKQMTHQAA
jgi:hypothetical protein